MKLGMEVGLGPGHIVSDGDKAPLQQKGYSPEFLPIYCGQTAGWIKMPLGMEICLGPGHTVLDGDRTQPAFPPPPKRGKTTSSRPMSIVNKRLDGSRCHFVRR